MKFYDDLCRDAAGWLRHLGHQRAPQLHGGDAAKAFFQVMHQVPLPVPRAVYRSSGALPTLSAEEALGLKQLLHEVEQGHSLLPRMSSQIRRDLHDPLYSDWGISHFHLGTALELNGFVTRTSHAAFALVHREAFYLLAVLPHNPRPYEDIKLLKILKGNWPAVMETYRLNGITKLLGGQLGPEEIRQARKKFISMVELDGVVYAPPGGGVMSSGHSVGGLMKHDDMANHVYELQYAWAREMRRRPGRFRLVSPHVYVIDDHNGHYWQFNQPPPLGELRLVGSFRALPPWAHVAAQTVLNRVGLL